MAASLFTREASRRSPSARWCWAARGAAGASAGAAALAASRGPEARCHSVKDWSKGRSRQKIASEADLHHSNFHHQDHLLFGVPKKGRLYEKVAKLLEGAGIEFTRKERVDIAHCSSLPVSVVFLPASDIATYVGEGQVDLGITGEDVVAESEIDVKVLLQLGFGKCSLSVQAPKDAGKPTPADLAGKRVVTSFPNITRKFFQAAERPEQPTQIRCISGSVEAACSLGLADCVVDLVETGTTMRAAGLEEVAVVMQSQAVLIANTKTEHPELVEIIRKRIQGYLTAQAWVMVTYNVARSNLKRVEQITPGKRSPSVQPLEGIGDWVAVQALIRKREAASVMDDLEEAGATDILLTSLLSSRAV